jgi:hypothetical protein
VSEDKTFHVARRPLIAGLLGAIAVAAAGGVIYEWPRWMHHGYPRTPFDDLLAQLNDRESAAKLGSAVLSEKPRFDAKNAGQALRMKIGSGSVAKAVEGDIAGGRLVEVQGWLVPETLAELAGIAAKYQ